MTNPTVSNDVFEELAASVREGGAILRGTVTAARVFQVLLRVAEQAPEVVMQAARSLQAERSS